MNRASTTKAIADAFTIVRRRRRASNPEVSEMKNGTIPNGSTTMKMARKMVTISRIEGIAVESTTGPLLLDRAAGARAHSAP